MGDITPNDNISKEEKNRLENAAIDEMCQLLEGGMAGEKSLIVVNFEIIMEKQSVLFVLSLAPAFLDADV